MATKEASAAASQDFEKAAACCLKLLNIPGVVKLLRDCPRKIDRKKVPWRSALEAAFASGLAEIPETIKEVERRLGKSGQLALNRNGSPSDVVTLDTISAANGHLAAMKLARAIFDKVWLAVDPLAFAKYRPGDKPSLPTQKQINDSREKVLAAIAFYADVDTASVADRVRREMAAMIQSKRATDPRDDEGFYSIRGLADKYGVNRFDAFEKRIRAWMKDNAESADIGDVPFARRNEPQRTIRANVVSNIIREFMAK